jgi:nucleoside-triphosphatase THEP1
MNILINGAPGTGKTTLFRKLASELQYLHPVGFYTEEIKLFEVTRQNQDAIMSRILEILDSYK